MSTTAQELKAQNLNRAKFVESIYPELVNTSEAFRSSNFDKLYGHRVGKFRSQDEENGRRRPLIFEEDVGVQKSTFKSDYIPMKADPIKNNGKERDMKPNIYFDLPDEDQKVYEEVKEPFEPVKLAKPDDTEKKFLTYFDPSTEKDDSRTKSCYQSNFLSPTGHNIRATLSYKGLTPRLFHNQHHIYFGNDKELEGYDDTDKESPNPSKLYQSISQRSYKDFSSSNRDHKIFSVHEKKVRDRKKMTILEHYDTPSQEESLLSVQKKDYGWKDRTFEETEKRKNVYIKELRSTHFSLAAEDVIERSTTQGISFEPNQYKNFEKTISFKKIVKSAIPFDETNDRNEIKKNLNSLYRESFKDLAAEAKSRHENRKHPYFNHSEISFGSDEGQFDKQVTEDLSSLSPPQVKRITKEPYRPLNLFANEHAAKPTPFTKQSISKSDYVIVANTKNAQDRIQTTKEEMRLANQAHFSLGFDDIEYNSCTHDAYTGNKADKVAISKELGNASVNLQHVDYNGENHYLSEYSKELDGNRLKGFKTYHSTQRSNISNQDNYFKVEKNQPLTSHQLNYISPEYVKNGSY